MTLSSLVLLISTKHFISTAEQRVLPCLTLLKPLIVAPLAYPGQALRPFGTALYGRGRFQPPIAPKALQRRPRGPRVKKNAKPYASYFLRNEQPFTEQPVAVASAPVLRRLSPN